MSSTDDESALEEAFATDIAIWARVYAHEDWTAEKPAVRNLAQRLVRVLRSATTDDMASLCPLVECTASTVDQRPCLVCPHRVSFVGVTDEQQPAEP